MYGVGLIAISGSSFVDSISSLVSGSETHVGLRGGSRQDGGAVYGTSEIITITGTTFANSCSSAVCVSSDVMARELM